MGSQQDSRGEALALQFLNALHGQSKSGYLTLWTLEDKKTHWYGMNEVEKAASDAVRLRERYNVYFGIGLRKERLNERQRGTNNDISSLPCVWVEIDVKGGEHAAENLPSLDEAKAILDTFPLEPTIVNHSGGGIHCYWLFDKPVRILTVEDRTGAERMLARFQNIFILMARTRGFHIDKTADMARVLRVPGTFNRKAVPKRVYPLGFHDERRYTLLELREAIEEIENKLPKEQKQNPERRYNGQATPLPDADPEPIVKGCHFIQEYLDHKESATYPEWLAALSIGAFCEDYQDVCHEWSEGHPGYSESETNRKVAEIRSKMKPRTCAAINDEFGICQGCPFYQKINSPISLGMKRVQDNARNAPENDPQQKRKQFMRTDLGNAERLVYRHGKNLRYAETFGSWFIWDGKRWGEDRINQIQNYATETVRSMYKEANQEEDSDKRKSLIEHAVKSESRSKIEAMIALSRAKLPILPEKLDENQWLFNCQNGVIDLKTGELKPHDRSHFMTKISPVAYDPDATCPTWEQFLQDVMSDDNGKPKQDLIEFLQKAVGYSLTGDTSEQVLFFLYGTGRNGKSTFINTIRDILGDYGKQTNADTFTVRKNERVNNDIAALKGARLVSATESEEGARLAESLVKQLTGGEAIQARFLYQENFEYFPQFKIFFTTNHKPIIRGNDPGIWRRIRLIPFTYTIPEEKKNIRLPEKLKAEMPGILRWAIEGCLKWQREGLGNPDEVKAATEGYKEEMDILGSFISDVCVVHDLARCWGSELYSAYKEWCEESGEYETGKRKFNKRMEERGFKKKRGTGGGIEFQGIGIKSGDLQTYEETTPKKVEYL